MAHGFPDDLARYQHAGAILGDLRVWPDVPAEGLRRETDILVWLPPGYDHGQAAYPVVYLHDGHNLFDPERSNAGVTWAADRAFTALAEEGIEAICVGVPCSPTRRGEEYTPHPHPQRGGGKADAYLDFLVEQIKAHVDSTLRTRPEPEHTLVAGSSLGGIISMHAWLTRPEVFGGAGVFSPAFWWPGEPMLLDVEAALAAGPPPGRVYLDVGGREQPDDPQIERAYVRDAERVLTALQRAGVPTRYVYDSVATHFESAWAKRLPDALRWLLRGYAAPAPA